MAVWDYHQVPGVVGKCIEYDEAFFAPMEYQVLFVFVHFWEFTKDASGLLLFVVI
ncbi:hypothetical protein SDC9_168917 [bioreactor metagenome]|uniref:Uncharacterized protein n=1 Tax=bioreactor metagenome TaxID=1076179 RepID=A0A645G3R4_9ZZZZ